MTATDKLRELGLELPTTPPSGGGNFVRSVATEGRLVFLSGHGPRKPDGTTILGKLGRDLTVEDGYEAAKLTMLNALASLAEEIGDLNRVRRIVKLLGMVNCTEDFGQQPQVMNGASDLLVSLFGEQGRHARSAVGMQSLPGGMAVEIEMIVAVE